MLLQYDLATARVKAFRAPWVTFALPWLALGACCRKLPSPGLFNKAKPQSFCTSLAAPPYGVLAGALLRLPWLSDSHSNDGSASIFSNSERTAEAFWLRSFFQLPPAVPWARSVRKAHSGFGFE